MNKIVSNIAIQKQTNMKHLTASNILPLAIAAAFYLIIFITNYLNF
jgi:hypothetical protein